MLVHDVLIEHGYKLIDDAWNKLGRRTYLHDHHLSASNIKNVHRALRGAGWEKDLDAMWVLNHPLTNEVLEFEPGGEDTDGHFVHYMKIFIST